MLSFPHKGMHVLLVFSVYFLIEKLGPPNKNMSDIHKDHITPNIILINPNVKDTKQQEVTRMT